MIPNTIPLNYVRKPSLQLPLTIENNQSNFWPFLIVTIGAGLALLYVIVFRNSVNINLLWFFIFITPIFVLLWFLALVRFIGSPPQNILIESTQITVKSKFRSAKIYPSHTLAYITLYSDRVVSDNARPFLFLFNLGREDAGSFVGAIINSFFKSSIEWAFFMRLDRTKIAIHTKDGKDLILLDVPTKKLSIYIQDLGLLLGIPVKM